LDSQEASNDGVNGIASCDAVDLKRRPKGKIMESKNTIVSQRTVVAVLALGLLTMSVVGVMHAQTKLTYGQTIFLMKSLKPALKSIGVMESTLSTEEIEGIVRAASGQGIKVTIAKVEEARDISGLYKELVAKHAVDMVWIPDSTDKLLLGIGFEYLMENTILDRVGLCVPDRKLVERGALCSCVHENDKFTVYVNQQIARIEGLIPPTALDPAIAYVVR
jgi:ABC-type uncharacterized transport system substrate-binding protein